jgi:MoaA/NifB/PqqE/SkfB family radical SAM enzyme
LDVILKGIRELQDLGACVLGITGGEPLLRGDLEKIIAAVDNRSSTILYSSGDGLTRQRAIQLADCGLNSAIISIDHYDPKKHDHQRRYDGSFQIAVKAVEIFSNLNVYTAATIIPTGDMTEEQNLLRYLDCAREWGAHEVRIGIPLPSGKLLRSLHEGKVRLSRTDINRIKKIQINANSQIGYPNVMAFPIIEGLEMFGCGAGYHYLAIENDGNVIPCVLVPMSFGNIKDESLHAIWRRMHPIFNRAGGVCYISRAAYMIFRDFMDGSPLPLPPERSLAICRQVPVERNDPLPMFYKKASDFIGQQNRSTQVINGGDSVGADE